MIAIGNEHRQASRAGIQTSGLLKKNGSLQNEVQQSKMPSKKVLVSQLGDDHRGRQAARKTYLVALNDLQKLQSGRKSWC